MAGKRKSISSDELQAARDEAQRRCDARDQRAAKLALYKKRVRPYRQGIKTAIRELHNVFPLRNGRPDPRHQRASEHLVAALRELKLLAGVRPGEASALRWRHYDPTVRPLGKLLVAKSYSTRVGEKTTKTDAVKHVPVHPTLAAMLAEWKLGGWAGPGLPDHLDPKDPRWFSTDCIEPPPVGS